MLDKFIMYHDRAKSALTTNLPTVMGKQGITVTPQMESEIKMFLEFSTARSIYFGKHILIDFGHLTP